MSWGSPPGGQTPPPFGSPLLRTPLLWSTTSMPPTIRPAYVKIGFVCLLDYFAFLTHAFTCLSGLLRIATRWRAGIRLCWYPLQHYWRIRQQWPNTVVLVLLSLAIVWCLLSLVVNYSLELSNLFRLSWTCCKLYIGFADVYSIYSAYFGGSHTGEAAKIGNSKKTLIFVG
jgi:hypothetical protein